MAYKKTPLRDKLEVLATITSPTQALIVEPKDRLDYIKEYLVLADKDSGKVISAACLNEEQVEFIQLLIELEVSGNLPWVDVLKARQIGLSTATQLYQFTCATTVPGQHCLTVSHKKESAEYIFGMSQRCYRGLPADQRMALDYDTMGFMRYAMPHGSSIRVGTAEDKELGSSQRIHRVHLSELAKWRRPRDPYNAVMQCVPSIPETCVVIEFTARGAGHLAQQIWDAANSGNNDYRPLFYSWRNHKKYALGLAKGETLELTQREQNYMEKYNLSYEQMKWAQFTRTNKCAGDYDLFNQEYPITPEVAWLAGGSSYFNQGNLNDALRKEGGTVRPPDFRGNVTWRVIDDLVVELEEDKEGHLNIWEHPIDGRHYVIGGDVGEGIGSDWTVFQVWRCPTDANDLPEQVAKFRSHRTDADEAGLICFLMGIYYNEALVGVERNGPGLTVLSILQTGHIACPATKGGYPNLYYQTTIDRKIQEETQRLGWVTSHTSKTMMLTGLKGRINRNELILRSQETVLELRGFSYDWEHREYVQSYENPTTKQTNDDEIMSSALADQMLNYYLVNQFFRVPRVIDYEEVV